MVEGKEVMEGKEVRSKSPIWGTKKSDLTREQCELIRSRKVKRSKDFIFLVKVKARMVNVLQGLELHTGLFSAAEHKRIVDFLYQLQDNGRKNELVGGHTYSNQENGCVVKEERLSNSDVCYNYAAENGNPPGILKNVLSDPLPPLFKTMIKRIVQWHVLPP